MKKKKIDEATYVTAGDLVEIHESFVIMTGCRFGLVIEQYRLVPPPSTHLKRSMALILKSNGTIGRIPFSFIKEVYRNES
jgi:hypothetical protein